MTHIDLRILDGPEEGIPWADMPPAGEMLASTAEIDRALVVNRMTPKGNPAVLLYGVLPDGRRVCLLTSATLYDMVAGAVRGSCKRWQIPNW